MFNLEAAIGEWRRGMAAGGIGSEAALDELESHVREAFADEVMGAPDEATAFAAAVQRLGPIEELKAEFALAERERERMRLLRKLRWWRRGAVTLAMPGFFQALRAAPSRDLAWVCGGILYMAVMVWMIRRSRRGPTAALWVTRAVGTAFIVLCSVATWEWLLPGVRESVGLTWEEAHLVSISGMIFIFVQMEAEDVLKGRRLPNGPSGIGRGAKPG